MIKATFPARSGMDSTSIFNDAIFKVLISRFTKGKLSYFFVIQSCFHYVFATVDPPSVSFGTSTELFGNFQIRTSSR